MLQDGLRLVGGQARWGGGGEHCGHGFLRIDAYATIVAATIITTCRLSLQPDEPPLPPVKPQGCTNLKLRQLMRRVAQRYDAEVGQVGLKGTQYSLLSHVIKLGPIRPVDLAAA